MHQTCVLDLREGEIIIKVSVYSAVNEYRLDRGVLELKRPLDDFRVLGLN